MSRLKVEFIRAHTDGVNKCNVGHKAQMRKNKAEELISRKIVRIYEGQWPPKTKSKINLKDLK